MKDDVKRVVSHDKYEPHLYNDHFQNYKRYNIPKAQLIIADIPYNIGKNAYGSNPWWYIGGDSSNGESVLANKEFFDTDKDFRISEFLCAGSGSTLYAAIQTDRQAYGFEIKKDFYKAAKSKMLKNIQKKLF